MAHRCFSADLLTEENLTAEKRWDCCILTAAGLRRETTRNIAWEWNYNRQLGVGYSQARSMPGKRGDWKLTHCLNPRLSSRGRWSWPGSIALRGVAHDHADQAAGRDDLEI